jgi:hypothetical protein
MDLGIILRENMIVIGYAGMALLAGYCVLEFYSRKLKFSSKSKS